MPFDRGRTTPVAGLPMLHPESVDVALSAFEAVVAARPKPAKVAQWVAQPRVSLVPSSGNSLSTLPPSLEAEDCITITPILAAAAAACTTISLHNLRSSEFRVSIDSPEEVLSHPVESQVGSPVEVQLPADLEAALEGGLGNRLEHFDDFDACGKGTCATVFKVRHRQSSLTYALKRITLLDSRATADQIEYQKRTIRRELVLFNSKHSADHIVPIYDVFKTGGHVYLLLEYMCWSLERILKTAGNIPFASLKSLKDRYLKSPPACRHKKNRAAECAPDSTWGVSSTVASSLSAFPCPSPTLPRSKNTRGWRARGSPIPERVIACFTYQILCGMQQLHKLVYAGTKCGAVHGDLKPDNILMSNKGVVKITDFGCCAFVGAEGMVQWSPFNAGARPYTSPERLVEDWMGRGQAVDAAFAQSADVWATGITTLEMACGCHPCSELVMRSRNGRGGDFLYQAQLCYENLLQPVRAFQMSNAFTDFTMRTLAFDPRDRPSSQSLHAHPWFKLHNVFHPERNAQLKRWVDSVFAHQETSARAKRERVRRQQSRALTEVAARRHGCGAEVWRGFKFRGAPQRDPLPLLDPSEWPLLGSP